MGDFMINIADQYSPYPAGRTAEDGPNNGGRFREEQLVPLLNKAIAAGEKLTVSFDGLKVCGSSFLDSAFGGLVRSDGFSRKDISRYLELVAENPQFERYLEAARRYINVAKAE